MNGLHLLHMLENHSIDEVERVVGIDRALLELRVRRVYATHSGLHQRLNRKISEYMNANDLDTDDMFRTETEHGAILSELNAEVTRLYDIVMRSETLIENLWSENPDRRHWRGDGLARTRRIIEDLTSRTEERRIS